MTASIDRPAFGGAPGLEDWGTAYGLLPSWGEPLVRWVVQPGAVGSGLAMWFAAPLRRFARRVVGASPARGAASVTSRTR